MLRIFRNLQDQSEHVSSTDSYIYRARGPCRPLSEAIKRDNEVVRTPDRRAGPVIRRARSARLFTSDHHHAASIASPASPPPPPSPKKVQSQISPCRSSSSFCLIFNFYLYFSFSFYSTSRQLCSILYTLALCCLPSSNSLLHGSLRRASR